MHRMRVLLDDSPGLWVNKAPISVLNRNCDGIAACRTLSGLSSHRVGGFKSRRTVAAIKSVAFATRAGRSETRDRTGLPRRSYGSTRRRSGRGYRCFFRNRQARSHRDGRGNLQLGSAIGTQYPVPCLRGECRQTSTTDCAVEYNHQFASVYGTPARGDLSIAFVKQPTAPTRINVPCKMPLLLSSI